MRVVDWIYLMAVCIFIPSGVILGVAGLIWLVRLIDDSIEAGMKTCTIVEEWFLRKVFGRGKYKYHRANNPITVAKELGGIEDGSLDEMEKYCDGEIPRGK